MNESILIEIHVISSCKKTIIDIDCNVGVDTTLSDILEIVFTNYNLEAEGVAAMFAFIPFLDNPLEFHAQDCKICGIAVRDADQKFLQRYYGKTE